MRDKITAPRLRAMKSKGEKIVFVTAYDFTSGQIVDSAGVDAILVGDSLGNVVLGFDTTLPVGMAEMLHHVSATARGVTRALLVADMPFGSFQCGVERAVEAAVQLAKAGAEAVKLEGPFLEEVRAIEKAGIPVMGHIGFTPQSVNRFGGFKVQGRSDGDALIEAAKSLEDAGVFSIVLELVPADLALRITESVTCPTIGIGAGPGCDGQVQVFHDLLGLGELELRHAKRYAEGRALFFEAVQRYRDDVRSATFPGPENSF